MPSSRRGTAAWRIAGWKAAEKQKVMPASLGDLGDARRGQVEPDAERLEHVGRAGLRGGRAVAVLDHARAGAGGDDRRHGGDVDRHRPVTARADDVEQPAGHRDRVGRGEHRRGDAGDLLDRLALGAQRHDEAGELDGGRRAGEDLVHGPSRLLGRQVATGDQRGEDVGPGVGHGPQASGARAAAARGVRRWPGPTGAAGR